MIRTMLITRIRVAKAFHSTPFTIFWTGQTVSALGDGAFYAALAWQVMLIANAATALSVVVGVEIIPRLFFILIGGVVADRLPRRLVLMWCDLARGLSVTLIAILSWTGTLQVWHLAVLSIFFGVIRGFFYPAFQSIAPELVDKEYLQSANTLISLAREASKLVGPPLGALFIAVTGPAGAFAFDGLTFFIAGFSLLALRMPAAYQRPAPAPAAQAKRSAGSALRRLGGDIWAGVGYVRTSTWLWVGILVASLANLGLTGPRVIALPILVKDVYGAGPWLLGMVLTLTAIGAVVGALIIAQLNQRQHRGLTAYVALLLTGVAMICFGLPLPRTIAPWVAMTASVFIGLGLGVFDVIWTTLLQELVPQDKLGRVTSIDMVGSLGLTPIGYAASGVLTDSIGPSRVFLVGGVIVVVLVAIALSVREVRQLQ
jgi:MFS family permease